MTVEWLSLNGEIVNQARTLVFARAGLKPVSLAVTDCCACDETAFATAVDGNPYLLPSTPDREAPWYSADEPLSGDVAGLLIENITGLGPAPIERTTMERLGHGSVLGRSKYTARTIVVTGAVLARTTEAAEWYVSWLADRLRDDPCDAGRRCAGHDLCFYASCPQDGDGCNPNEEEPASYATRLAAYARTLHRAALFSGPEILDRVSRGACDDPEGYELIRLQFSLLVADPFAYAPASTVLTNQTLTACPGSPTCITWNILDLDEECPDPCAEVSDCEVDPLCPTPATPPAFPVIADPCACTSLTASRTCFAIPASALATQGDNVPVLQVYAGSTDLRGIRAVLIPNPLALSPSALSDCDACFEINLPFLPNGTTWTLDASRRTSEVFCPPGSYQAATVSGAGGGPFLWPEITCATSDYVLCLEVSCSSWNSTATVSLDMIPRLVG